MTKVPDRNSLREEDHLGLWFQPIKLEGVVTFMTAEAWPHYVLEVEEAERLGRKQERAATHKGRALFSLSPPATYRPAPVRNHKIAVPTRDLLLQHRA